MKKKQRVMYEDYQQNPVRSILKARKAKRRRKKIRLLLSIFIVILIASFFASDYSRIASISVSGNKLVEKQEIIDASEVKVRQDFTFFTDIQAIRDKIKELPLIKNVKVNKNITGEISIKVSECDVIGQAQINNILYLIDENGKIAIDSQNKLAGQIQLWPTISNFDENTLKEFAKEYTKLPYAVISQTTNINYAPQSADEKRCEFVMDDGKILYLRYDQMAEQLKGNYYALLMEKYPDDKYYDFLGKYVYRSK